MKVALLQTDIFWANPEANRKHIEEMVAKVPKSDVYVLPEMFSTGFVTDPTDVAESLEKAGNTYQWMLEMARKYDAAFAGSIATEARDEENEVKAYYNRFYFAKPDGSLAWYDKRHLFSIGGEDKFYTAGKEKVVVEFRGVKFLLQVCYDLRFPVFSRNGLLTSDDRNDQKEADYDVALYVASWPKARIEVFRTLAHARAIENQCYVAAVNRIGKEPYCQYEGSTMFIDAYGRTQAEIGNEEGYVTGEIDMEKLRAFRKKFPVLKDKD